MYEVQLSEDRKKLHHAINLQLSGEWTTALIITLQVSEDCMTPFICSYLESEWPLLFAAVWRLNNRFNLQLSGDWKNLRRAFKKLDQQNQGYLSLPEFRSVLKLANVILDEDEIYHLMSHFDEDMTGKISYNKFLNETFKPDSRMSQQKLMPQHTLLK